MLQRQNKGRIGAGESLHVDTLTAEVGRGFVSLAWGLSDSLMGEGRVLDHTIINSYYRVPRRKIQANLVVSQMFVRKLRLHFRGITV